MRTKVLLLIVVALLLVLPLFSFAGVKIAAAEEPYPSKAPYKYIKYPGPFGPYEKDVVTVACCNIEKNMGDKPYTLAKMERYVTQAAEKGANIILFAEEFLGGKTTSEPFPGPSSLEIAELTKKLGVYVVYGFFQTNTEDPSKYWNSAAIIGPKGPIAVYHKIHTFLAEEAKGKGPVAFDTPWGPIGVGICYDTYNYPELCRTYSLMGARLYLNLTGTPDIAPFDDSSTGVVNMMLQAVHARVWENYIFVATANRVGWWIPDQVRYVGHSNIVGPPNQRGQLPNFKSVYWAGPGSYDKEELVMATLDLSLSDHWRGVLKPFQPIAEHGGASEFSPQMWADLWGTPATPPVDKELEAKTQELEVLRVEKEKMSQNFYIVGGIAALLLVSTIFVSVVAFRKRKN